VSWKAPTDSTIGQSARPGHARRLSAASITKAASADSVARAAASHTGVLADRPILMAGQVSPNSTTVAPSCSHATFMRTAGVSPAS